MKAVWSWSPLLLVALLWEAANRFHFVDPQMLPSLADIGRAWSELFMSGDLAREGLSSLITLSSGLVLALVFGVTAGLLMARYQAVRYALNPLLKALYPMPKSALIPLMMVWFGLGFGSKIASVFMGCVLPVVVSAYNGARGVDHALVWSALSMGAKPRAILSEVIFPAALPEILAGARNALALSFVLLVAAELLIGSSGLGYLISFLGEGGVYDGMFAALFTVTIAGFLADRAFLLLTKKTLAWRE